MKRLIMVCAFIMLHSLPGISQEYLDEGPKRLNFAKTYLELGTQYYPSFISSGLTTNPDIFTESNSSSIVPYLNIGGFHFWGHAEFYISIPLFSAHLQDDKFSDYRLDHSGITGARYLPWAYKNRAVRPYVGAAWTVAHFQLDNREESDLPLLSKNQLSLDAGLIYGSDQLSMRLGFNYHPFNEWDSHVSALENSKQETPKWSINLGFIYSMETTKTEGATEENNRLNSYSTFSSPKQDSDKKGDWFVALGPSSSFSLRASAYNESFYPFLNKKPISKAFLDYGIGYHLNQRGLVFSAAYRDILFENEGFGVSHQLEKKSFLVEAYKFLTDYNGFTPYVGINLSYNSFQYDINNSGGRSTILYSPISPGLTFGWDILPGKTQQRFVLRTNLRWFPFDRVELDGYELNFSQLEYNVIQLVFYPFR